VDQLAKPIATAELDAWKQLTQMVLAAVSDHAVHCGETDADPFRRRIQESLTALKDCPGDAQVLTAAGSLSQAIVNHSMQTQRRVDTLQTELQSLHRTVSFHLGETSGNTEELASALESRRRETEALINRLQDRITILEQTAGSRGVPAAPAANLDLCTGLPNRTEAEAAIRRAVATDDQTYVAVFYLHRMNLLNARFGAAIGDQVILHCSQHLATSIVGSGDALHGDALYRWSGPAFLAILTRSETPLKVGGEVQRVASSPTSRFFETASRTVFLPVKLTGEVFLASGRLYAEVADQVEQFILRVSSTAV